MEILKNPINLLLRIKTLSVAMRSKTENLLEYTFGTFTGIYDNFAINWKAYEIKISY